MAKRMAAALLAASALLLGGCARPLEQGALIVTLQDGSSGQPVAGAQVVLAQTGQVSQTDSQGRTEALYLSCPAALRPSDPSWGEATLLIYCEGYADTVLLNVQTPPGQIRSGPVVLLFPPTASGEPFVVYESPPSAWTSRLLDTFRP